MSNISRIGKREESVTYFFFYTDCSYVDTYGVICDVEAHTRGINELKF